MVLPFWRKSIKMIPRVSQKTDAITLPADGTVFAFFGADSPGPVHYFDCCFVSGVKWWTHVMNRRRTSALLLRNIAKHPIETPSRRCFCSIVNKRGTHLAYNFFMPKFSVNMRCTPLFEMPNMSAISGTFSWWSSNTLLWIFLPFPVWSHHLVDHYDVPFGSSYSLV